MPCGITLYYAMYDRYLPRVFVYHLLVCMYDFVQLLSQDCLSYSHLLTHVSLRNGLEFRPKTTTTRTENKRPKTKHSICALLLLFVCASRRVFALFSTYRGFVLWARYLCTASQRTFPSDLVASGWFFILFG